MFGRLSQFSVGTKLYKLPPLPLPPQDHHVPSSAICAALWSTDQVVCGAMSDRCIHATFIHACSRIQCRKGARSIEDKHLEKKSAHSDGIRNPTTYSPPGHHASDFSKERTRLELTQLLYPLSFNLPERDFLVPSLSLTLQVFSF